MVKRFSTSKLAMAYLKSILAIFLPNAKDSLRVYLLIVNGDKIGTWNFANLYNCALMGSSIGFKDRQFLMTDLCTLA